MEHLRRLFPIHATVTPRERDVLECLLHGLSQPEAGQELDVAPSTIRMHVKHLHHKSHTRNLHSLVVWAVAHARCCLDAAEPPA